MPKLNIRKGPAAHYAGRNEAIFEVTIGDKGGLISIHILLDGTPVIDLYNFDPEVEIRIPEEAR